MLTDEQIKLYLDIFKGLTLQDVQDILQHLEEIHLKPNDIYIRPGEKEKKVGYIREGLIKASAINDEEEEIVCLLRWEGQFVGSFNRSAQFVFKAIEPTTVLELKYDIIEGSSFQNTPLDRIFKEVVFHYLVESIEHLKTFVMLTPEQRYRQLLHSKPDIINRVPDKYIANILGITPVSLSRIRKRMATR